MVRAQCPGVRAGRRRRAMQPPHADLPSPIARGSVSECVPLQHLVLASIRRPAKSDDPGTPNLATPTRKVGEIATASLPLPLRHHTRAGTFALELRALATCPEGPGAQLGLWWSDYEGCWSGPRSRSGGLNPL